MPCPVLWHISKIKLAHATYGLSNPNQSSSTASTCFRQKIALPTTFYCTTICAAIMLNSKKTAQPILSATRSTPKPSNGKNSMLKKHKPFCTTCPRHEDCWNKVYKLFRLRLYFPAWRSNKDAPSWVKQAGHKPCKNPNESGNQFAKRILDEKYGAGNWKTGPGTEHNQIKKYGDRAFK